MHVPPSAGASPTSSLPSPASALGGRPTLGTAVAAAAAAAQDGHVPSSGSNALHHHDALGGGAISPAASGPLPPSASHPHHLAGARPPAAGLSSSASALHPFSLQVRSLATVHAHRCLCAAAGPSQRRACSPSTSAPALSHHATWPPIQVRCLRWGWVPQVMQRGAGGAAVPASGHRARSRHVSTIHLGGAGAGAALALHSVGHQSLGGAGPHTEGTPTASFGQMFFPGLKGMDVLGGHGTHSAAQVRVPLWPQGEGGLGRDAVKLQKRSGAFCMQRASCVVHVLRSAGVMRAARAARAAQVVFAGSASVAGGGKPLATLSTRPSKAPSAVSSGDNACDRASSTLAGGGVGSVSLVGRLSSNQARGALTPMESSQVRCCGLPLLVQLRASVCRVPRGLDADARADAVLGCEHAAAGARLGAVWAGRRVRVGRADLPHDGQPAHRGRARRGLRGAFWNPVERPRVLSRTARSPYDVPRSMRQSMHLAQAKDVAQQISPGDSPALAQDRGTAALTEGTAMSYAGPAGDDLCWLRALYLSPPAEQLLSVSDLAACQQYLDTHVLQDPSLMLMLDELVRCACSVLCCGGGRGLAACAVERDSDERRTRWCAADLRACTSQAPRASAHGQRARTSRHELPAALLAPSPRRPRPRALGGLPAGAPRPALAQLMRRPRRR